jgi:hypothetical protein
MSGPPPPFAWRPDGGYQPPLRGGSAIYGVPPNPNLFFNDGNGPPPPLTMLGLAVPQMIPAGSLPVTAPAPNIQPLPMQVPAHSSTFHFVTASWGSTGQVAPPPGPGLGYDSWRPGINVLPPTATTHIQVYWRSEKAWEGPHTCTDEERAHFQFFAVDVEKTVSQLIEQLVVARNGAGAKAADWALSEWSETGNGRFHKGSTFKHGEEKSNINTLNAVGWTARRGNQLPPVTIQMHKLA